MPNHNLVGNHVEVTYFDQNDTFKEQLPREGIIQKRLKTDNVDNWFLIELDRPVMWEGYDYLRMLIRTRWEDHEINSVDQVSVFILLVSDEQIPLDDLINPNEYIHVAWGNAKILNN